MAVDFLLDSTGDINLNDNNSISLTSNIEESSKQQVLIWLSVFRGEWFANTLAGIPYLNNDSNSEQLMGTSNKSLFDVTIREGILTRENIQRLVSYESVFNRAQRTLTVSFSAITDSGEVVTVEDISVTV